VNPNFLIRN